MRKLEAVIGAMFAGTPARLDERGTMSAIRKSQVSAPWHITDAGLVRDEQADLVHHGGRDKAIHQYPRDHYASWIAELPSLGEHDFAPGAFGENLSIANITEADVCIGDVFRAGSAVLQISQGRQPCFKLNARFGEKRMAFLVQKTGRTGWYYRVLEAGTIGEGMRSNSSNVPPRMGTLAHHRASLQKNARF